MFPLDYNITSQFFPFDDRPNSGAVACVLVDIIEDSIFECPETFLVELQLQASSTAIELGPSALVYIRDNEGKITDIV